MKNLFLLVVLLTFCMTPVFAQHHPGGGGSSVSAPSSHVSAPSSHVSAPSSHAGAVARSSGGSYHSNAMHYRVGVTQDQHRAQHTPIIQESRRHYDGRHFDHAYFRGHWGRYHPFFWGNVWWYGPRCYPNSWFWYDGAYFTILEPIPDPWCYDEVYVDEYNGDYVLVNPVYPGVYFRLGVRF